LSFRCLGERLWFKTLMSRFTLLVLRLVVARVVALLSQQLNPWGEELKEHDNYSILLEQAKWLPCAKLSEKSAPHYFGGARSFWSCV